MLRRCGGLFVTSPIRHSRIALFAAEIPPVHFTRVLTPLVTLFLTLHTTRVRQMNPTKCPVIDMMAAPDEREFPWPVIISPLRCPTNWPRP